MVYTLDNSKALILSVRPDGSSPASTKAPVEALNRIAYGGNVLAAVGGSNLMLYTLPSMELKFNIALGTSTSSIAFNDDASQVLVPLGDKCRIYDVVTGGMVREWDENCSQVAWSGKYIATVGATYRMWDAQTRAKLYEIAGMDASPFKALFDRTCDVVYVCHTNGGIVNAWYHKQGRVTSLLGHNTQGCIRGLAISADSSLLVTGNFMNDEVIAWNTATCSVVWRRNQYGPCSVAILGNTLYVASAGRAMMSYNLKDGTVLHTYENTKPSYPYAAFVYPGGSIAPKPTADPRDIEIQQLKARIASLEGVVLDRNSTIDQLQRDNTALRGRVSQLEQQQALALRQGRLKSVAENLLTSTRDDIIALLGAYEIDIPDDAITQGATAYIDCSHPSELLLELGLSNDKYFEAHRMHLLLHHIHTTQTLPPDPMPATTTKALSDWIASQTTDFPAAASIASATLRYRVTPDMMATLEPVVAAQLLGVVPRELLRLQKAYTAYREKLQTSFLYEAGLDLK